MQSVNGFIKKDDFAYSIYFATLQTGHDSIVAGLTISIGKWWNDTKASIKQREWIYMRVWPSESGSGFEIRIEEPDNSRHFNFSAMGKAITCAEARRRDQLDDFFDVAKYAIDHDPALLSYLSGDAVNIAGRTCVH
jgi:hypothetical protein